MIFTDSAAKKYKDFIETDFARVDESLGVKYEKGMILEDTILLLRYNCPDPDCDTACLGWPHLHRHVKQKHGKLMCDLCTRNKKVFTHEHELFTPPELRRHERFGDERLGHINRSGFRGHPECGFCRQRFYGDDELYGHCREKHERCHICDRRNPGSQVQYYLNYQMLEKHFEAEHFICLDAECQENKTNVFETEMDLKAHQLSSHPNGLSKDARRDARLVDISSFDYRAPYQPPRRERERRRGGRGPDPNAEALPVSSAQPLRRDELAYQRQMAILNAPPQPPSQIVPRNHAASPMPPSAQPAATARPEEAPDLSKLSVDPFALISVGDQSMTLQDQARRVRHNSVLQRASNLVQADVTKLAAFRNQVSAYTSSSIKASELIDSFFSFFDVPSAELGKLVRELADIYEDETKRQDLLKAWNDWLSINADYPSLPGPNGVLAGSGGDGTNGRNDIGSSGRRVLKLKGSTAQSSRSEVSRQSSWGNAVINDTTSQNKNSSGSSASPSVSSAFPPLAQPSSKKTPQSRNAWPSDSHLLNSTNPRSPNATISRPTSAVPSRLNRNNSSSNNLTNDRLVTRPKTSSMAKTREEMFPALPAGKKPNTLMLGLNRGAVRWDTDNASANAGVSAWNGHGGGGGGGNEILSEKPRIEGIDGSGGRGKKGKKGKQVLYKFG